MIRMATKQTKNTLNIFAPNEIENAITRNENHVWKK